MFNLKLNLSAEQKNVTRILCYLTGTAFAIAIPAGSVSIDFLLLRMHFDYGLFGLIKSSMFLLPGILYLLFIAKVRARFANTTICRWGYLFRILIPLWLPVSALISENPAWRMGSCLLVFSLGLSVAMFANNTLMSIYKESIPAEKFNRYTLFFLSFFSAVSMVLIIPMMYVLGDKTLSDTQFFIRFMELEILTGLFYIPAFLSLRNLHVLNPSQVPKPFSIREQILPYKNREFILLQIITMIQSIWVGILVSYWNIFLLSAGGWSAGKLAVWEGVLMVLCMFAGPVFGKAADKFGYPIGFTLMILPMLAVEAGSIVFHASWILMLLVLFIHNGGGIFALPFRFMVQAAIVKKAPEGKGEIYMAQYSLVSQLSIFLGCVLSPWLLKLVCGVHEQPDAGDFRLFFLLNSLLLIPQWILSFFLKKKSC